MRCPTCNGSGWIDQPLAPLSRRQSELLTYIRKYIVIHGYAPTLEEMAAKLGVRSITTIHEHLVHLERKRKIFRIPCERRGITLVVNQQEAAHGPEERREVQAS